MGSTVVQPYEADSSSVTTYEVDPYLLTYSMEQSPS